MKILAIGQKKYFLLNFYGALKFRYISKIGKWEGCFEHVPQIHDGDHEDTKIYPVAEL